MASDHEVRFLRGQIQNLAKAVGEVAKELKAQRSREKLVENYIKSLEPVELSDKEPPRLHLVCTTCYTENCLADTALLAEDCECCKNSHSPNKIKDQI